jgi:hypothetical protein
MRTLLVLVPLFWVFVASDCPSAHITAGCYAKETKYASECKPFNETACDNQIVCEWSDGPHSGTTYSVLDTFLNTDQTDVDCFESSNLSALVQYMATVVDSGAKHHKKGPPRANSCTDCYPKVIWYNKTHKVADGVSMRECEYVTGGSCS